jgi:hypothetical protein
VSSKYSCQTATHHDDHDHDDHDHGDHDHGDHDHHDDRTYVRTHVVGR